MLKFGEMRWSYAFSYGANNKINFEDQELLQLVGFNGHGKSSIALILEEVLFNKNSKGSKRGKILNRYSGSKTYTIELDFTKDLDVYQIKTSRSSTQTVKLIKNGLDISEHTATATYKLIEQVLGFDHKTFTQIVYQNSAFSLEFLSATDTNRKKFLIDLLRLVRYGVALEYYKEKAKELSKEVELLSTKHTLASSILNKYTAKDLEIKKYEIVPQVDISLEPTLLVIAAQLAGIDKTNAAISQNNTYKSVLDDLNVSVVPSKPEDITPWKIKESELTKEIATNIAKSKGLNLAAFCGICKQPIDNSHKLLVVEESNAQLAILSPQLLTVVAKIVEINKLSKEYTTAVDVQLQWEKYYALIDKTMPSVLLDKKQLSLEYATITKTLADQRATKVVIETSNQRIAAHNARVEVLESQIATAKIESDKLQTQMLVVKERLTNIQILVKTFSTNGLVAYKIEGSIKELEQLTNEYLQDMSDGRFQLAFKMNSTDKLDVIITDNGTDIEISELSNGELARVNISTLLAIRKLMQTLSNTKANLLILDETVEALDADGKERLVEVLLKEEYLNTVLVSHSFTHPLITKLHIVKENNISRIE